jgi:hypothetical protein
MTKAEKFRPFFEELYKKYNKPEYVGKIGRAHV